MRFEIFQLGEWALESVDKIFQLPFRESPQPWWCLFSGAMICRRSRSPSAARLKAEFGARPDQWNGRRKSCWRKINTVERRHDTLQITAIYRAHKGGIEGKRAAAELLLYCLSSRDYRSPPAFCQHLIFPKLGENWPLERIPCMKWDPFLKLSSSLPSLPFSCLGTKLSFSIDEF